MESKKINIKKIPIIHRHIYHRIIDGCCAVVDVKNKNFHRLNKIGTIIFKLMDGKRNIDEIAAIVREQFDISTSVAKKDCLKFISTLSKKGLLTLSFDYKKRSKET